MFVGLHAAIGMSADMPELAISDQEGKSFQIAVQNVLRHYSVRTTQKAMDWIALAGVSGGIYAPRVVAISIRRRGERVARGQPVRQGNVVRPAAFGGRPGGPEPAAEAPPLIVPDEFGGGEPEP